MDKLFWKSFHLKVKHLRLDDLISNNSKTIWFVYFSDLAKSGLFPRDSITFEDDEDIDAKHLSQKNVPPVKKKMLWKQKKKSYQQKSIVFNENEDDIKFKDEELNVPKERLFKSQLKVKIKKYFLNSHFDLKKTIPG